MFSHQQTLSYQSRSNIIIWLSLAFQAGAINTGGFLACHRFVSHVTGFGTMFGTEASIGNWNLAGSLLAVPAFFICGAMISAFFVDRRIQKNLRPLYSVVMGLILILMLVVVALGVTGYFGPFGEVMSVGKNYSLLAALSFACGMQNATITSAFGAIVRTTHLTGITTDLAIGAVRILSRSHRLQSRQNEVSANWMRIGLISFFILGSLISAYFYMHVRYWGFLIPAGIANILFIWSVISLRSLQHDGLT
jgi:Predicted membrane protein